MKVRARLTWTSDPIPRDAAALPEADDMYIVFLASCMGLALNAWEFLITLCDEVDLVWLSNSCGSPILRLVKGLFFFSRYLGLAVQSLNVVLAQRITSYRTVPIPICRGWMSYQIFVIFSFLSVVNVILYFRIYAIYRRSRRIYLLLLVVFFSRLILATPFAILYVPRLVFDRTCGFRVPGPIMAAFLVAEMATQSFALGLTFLRRRSSLNSIPTRSVLLQCFLYRDALLTYMAIFSALVATVVYGRVESFQGNAHFVFPIFVSILTISACRMIINILELRRDNPSPLPSESFELTLFLEELDSLGSNEESTENVTL